VDKSKKEKIQKGLDDFAHDMNPAEWIADDIRNKPERDASRPPPTERPLKGGPALPLETAGVDAARGFTGEMERAREPDYREGLPTRENKVDRLASTDLGWMEHARQVAKEQGNYDALTRLDEALAHRLGEPDPEYHEQTVLNMREWHPQLAKKVDFDLKPAGPPGGQGYRTGADGELEEFGGAEEAAKAKDKPGPK